MSNLHTILSREASLSAAYRDAKNEAEKLFFASSNFRGYDKSLEMFDEEVIEGESEN
ncbi:MAG: hypothetical protein GY861_21440 [bacterium]|nr:hypothetical protein [bacterium]